MEQRADKTAYYRASREDKVRILARAFYCDNRDEYEDYHEALIEMMSPGAINDKFLEFGVEPYLRVEPGCFLVMNEKDGQLAHVNEEEGLFMTVFDLSQDELEEMENHIDQVSEANPDLERLDLLKACGWKVLEEEPNII